ncbi:NAD-dependent protein deacetylase sirtuin-2 isoform X2 [Nematostella vectensis]|uniref:NAD-dependent protein deacetylase sirtuin-2 isoform X2 n=1 Tax=Nematostella vectensis TaxID=45351 RepID=UPI002077382E|nr:NAD-dependent protein deacetylase sirtuin-2 isoform X2 [Nematostella vectensis]
MDGKATSKDPQVAVFEENFERFGLPYPTEQDLEREARREQRLDDVSFEGIARYITSGKCKNIVVLTGAGISTTAGIPDFRTPGSGLFNVLQTYGLTTARSIFEIDYFQMNPKPFFVAAKAVYPGQFKPTISHYFIKLLQNKGLLLRHYTQNIDTLERVAGITGDHLMEAHGSFHTGHCMACNKEYSQDWIRVEIMADKIPRCTECDGVVKPDIGFFGDPMPDKFYQLAAEDFPKCDLLIVMGTSLIVQPFASLIARVSVDTPRLLINREKCGYEVHGPRPGFQFELKDNKRDVAWLGTTDDGCLALADLLGWKEHFRQLIENSDTK